MCVGHNNSSEDHRLRAADFLDCLGQITVTIHMPCSFISIVFYLYFVELSHVKYSTCTAVHND